MELIIYQERQEGDTAFTQFLDNLRSRQLNYLASDLIQEGLGPRDIVEAIRRATASCRTAGLEVDEHFKPLYSSYRGSLVRDCKLSRFGYYLTVINARPDSEITARWQQKLLEDLL